jgi:hypothetical protein
MIRHQKVKTWKLWQPRGKVRGTTRIPPKVNRQILQTTELRGKITTEHVSIVPVEVVVLNLLKVIETSGGPVFVSRLEFGDVLRQFEIHILNNLTKFYL